MNRNQLTVLTTDQADDIRALGSGLAVAEFVKIYWPSPDATTVYGWWNPLSDTIYTDALTDWLDGLDLIVAFEAQDQNKAEKFHEIPRTAAIGDDVVRFRFRNNDGVFEALATEHAGAKVEIFHFFPQIETGLAIQMWQGRLRTPDSVNTDWVEISAVEGFASPDLLCPSRTHAGQCTFAPRFGGRFLPVLPNNPCDYDLHDGGARGNNNPATGTPYTSCPGTKQDCIARLGDTLSYGGFDAVTDTSRIGNGARTTVSETQGQSTRLKDPVEVWYGEGKANSLKLLDFAKEYNPSSKHQDKGTIRALFEGSEGPIQGVSNFQMMDEDLPRVDGLGLETRLGTQQQSATTFSASVLNYNRLAHFRADKNPVDPRGITPSQITAKTNYEGRNTIRRYTDASTFTLGYSQLRAWVALDLVRDFVYGLADDVASHSITDFIYLAGKGSTFNGIAQGKSAHQQFTDICLAGLWLLPFNHNGVKRWLAIEDYDLGETDIPEFTDAGSNRNILVDERGISRLTARRRDDDQIPNEITLTFEDAAHDNLERPLLFPDEEQQELAGQKFGNGQLRKVPDQIFALGVNNIEDARKVGWYVLDYGKFYSGGSKNNGEITFYGAAFDPDFIDLHVNKVIKVTSSKLDNIKDRDGNVFTHFIVKALRNLPNGEIEVTAQAYKALRTANCPPVVWTNLTNAASDADGTLEKTTDTLSGAGCIENASGSGDAGARSVQSIQASDGDWEMQFSFDSVTEGRGFGGLTTSSGFTANYTQMRYCIHVSDQNNTIDPFPPHSWFIYQNGGSSVFQESGTYEAGDLFQIKCVSGVVKYYLNGVLKYTSGLAPSYPLYAAASLACLNKTINNVSLCVNGTISGGQTTTQEVIDSRYVVIDRIWRDQELSAGVPGFYVAAGPVSAPTTTEVWPGFELYREIGSYSLLHENDEEAVIGEAISVLAGTTGGSETVDVELRLGQTLPTSGFVWLGGELFNYGARTQLDTDPNQWRLSTLTNRGSRCTTAAMATHASGEDFALLDSANVFFVRLESSEIGVARNYKGITAGQNPNDFSADNLTLSAPNFTITTPADYDAAFDASRNEVVHTWTPISTACASLVGLVYEIYLDSGGSPGALLWSGASSSWRETISVTETRVYHFRARTNADTGGYETDSVSVTYTPGGSMVGGARWELLTDGEGNLVYDAPFGTPVYIFEED